MNQLFSDDEDTVGNKHQLTINEHYAKAFEYRKEREELERLKAKYGSDYDPDGSGSDFSTDSESAESEDEHGEELTPAVDAAILRTLARIKNKDPEIYNSQTNIFGVQTSDNPKVNLEAMLNPSRSASPESDGPGPMTHVREQEVLRRETIAAFHGAVDKVGDEDDFLIPREKTQDERQREEEEYRAFLEREVGDLKELVTVNVGDVSEEEIKEEDVKNEEEKKKKKKKSKKGSEEVKKTKAEKDQEFLLNYILNRGWIDRSEGHVPTYNEVTTSTQERRKKKGKAKADDKDEEDDPGLLSDASFESLASHFEASYNHRFEEPGAASIPSFPRNLPSLVRRQDTTRKDARERRKQRKEEELQKKKEEVRRLKALKMREVKRKLELIGRQGGLKKGLGGGAEDGEEEDGFVDEALRELDLDGEWDPEKHDRQMADLFDRGAEAFEDEEDVVVEGQDDEGDVDDGVRFDADGKPVWDDDIDLGDIPISDDDDTHVVFPSIEQPSKKEKKKKKKKKKGGEDGDGGVDIDAMDADVTPQFDEDEEWDGTEEMRKRKFNEYMDEIYGLDFNDMVIGLVIFPRHLLNNILPQIGDLPTRFKYVPVQPQTYALTPAEILMATDQELNEYMSVKKYAPYRHDKSNPQRWNKKTQEKLHELKAKVGERAGTSFIKGRGEDGQEKVKKRKGKKERMKLKAVNGDANGTADIEMEEATPSNGAKAPEPNGKGDKKRKRHSEEGDEEEGRRASREDTAQASVKNDESAAKKKRKRKHRKAEEEG
ncbi:hypothetical protein M413DRAFT_31398 [Hebeloma cylindrosporum]|uniref:Kri1-like C-terminal domain-containing protein n=1 Tax=Hebeloma cylindrosporum TaxID=76867 RepID=A0A0C3BJ71_HEBCY|nr:hypothetical protein M413DRAFT_31398 [Hebeloma cylindrosporum h7]